MKLIKWLIFIIITLLIIFTVLKPEKNNLNSPVDESSGEKVVYTVEDGATPGGIAYDLEDKNIIKSGDYLLEIFDVNQGMIYKDISYELSPSMSTFEIYKIITNPTSNFQGTKVLIYEGETIESVAKKVADVKGISQAEVLSAWDNTDFINEMISKHEILTNEVLNADIKHPLEGYFYPATYDISKNESLEGIAETFLTKFESTYSYYSENNSTDMTFHELLTLTSIVERETILESDKPKVAGVFYNRLDSGMKIQSDITVSYGMGIHKEVLSNEDLEYDSPYNTYKYEGLPPGPISMVGKTTMQATYDPEINDYLYFFATQDTGEVLYSKTLEEHEKISEENAWT